MGDPNQAIYAWNGADARYLIDFERYFPGGATVTLEDNYRSTPQVLTVANAVLSAGHSVPIQLRPHRTTGPVPTVAEHADETAEAEAVARSLRDHHPPGSRWGDQAVLVRTNAQAVIIAEVLTKSSVPHRIRGGGDLLRQPEVTQAIGAIRRAPDLQVALADLEDDVRRSTDPAAPGVRLSEERAANVRELIRLGHEYQALEPTGSVAAFASWLSSTLRGEDRDGGDAVDVATFHAAKGLEWPIVHLAGLEEGYVPIHHARDDPAALEEERRLLYVALTRARDELHCTWARSRTFGSRSAKRSPSPWLEIIAETVGLGPRRTPRREGAAKARATRASLRSGRDDLEPEHLALFEALRAWRRQVAKQADVPAFVVFNDATLAEVATRRPSTRQQLRSVSGIGPAKDQRFGDDVLRIVAEH